ncbi:MULTISPECIES: chromosome partitioning protein ParB [Proteus]|uniref:chromosome partitioning protein ParB n=1 Tax=Proteus TaxID=583 RepID=UPI0034D531D4
MEIKGQLISSQRYLNEDVVLDKVKRFKVFIVDILHVTLRGKQYTLLVNGHHNFAAAKKLGIKPQYRTPKKLLKAFNSWSQSERETFIINNLTDSHLYDVNTGEVVQELMEPDFNNMSFQRNLTNGLKLYQQ